MMGIKFLLMVIVLYTGVNANSKLSEKENQELDNLINKNIVYECDAVKDDNISAVLKGSIIFVKIKKLYDKNCTNVSDCGYSIVRILKDDNNFTVLEKPTNLTSCIRDSFKIISKKDAKIFEKMLDKLFPMFSSSGKDIEEKNGNWIFVRGKSFGEKKGILVTVNESGKIIEIGDEETLKEESKGENE